MPLQAWGSFWEVQSLVLRVLSSRPSYLHLEALMSHWAMPCPLWQWKMWMLTLAHVSAHLPMP